MLGLPTHRHGAARAVVPVVMVLLLAGCADFHQSAAPKDWHPQRQLSAEHGPVPVIPGAPRDARQPPGGAPSPGPVPPPDGCTDFDPAVIATCLNPVGAVAALPSTPRRPSALAGERSTGKVLRVTKGADPVVLRTLHVDASGGGGLTGLALSPTYNEDHLVFAYITTASDNRVVRFTRHDPPKPILTGIPKGKTGNAGALATDHNGALLVATGDAGKDARRNDPTSLAGKVLRIDTSGNPAPGNPTSGSPIVASGLHTPGGICSSSDGSQVWVTDRAAAAGVLYRIKIGQGLGPPAWRWPNRPGVAGCAAFGHTVMVATSVAGNVQSLPLNADGSFGGKPQVALDGPHGYGRLSGLDLAPAGYAVAGTVNKAGGDPVSSDDRVVVITPQTPAGAGRD